MSLENRNVAHRDAGGESVHSIKSSSAHMWFNLAAAQGHETAQKFRDIVVKLMTHGQLAEAQRMAREWMAKHQRSFEEGRKPQVRLGSA